MRRFVLAPVFSFVALGAAQLLACPLCNSDTGRLVRAGIINKQFGSNLLLTLLPGGVLLAIVFLIHLGWPATNIAAQSTGRSSLEDS
jgi:hypothetical protein